MTAAGVTAGASPTDTRRRFRDHRRGHPACTHQTASASPSTSAGPRSCAARRACPPAPTRDPRPAVQPEHRRRAEHPSPAASTRASSRPTPAGQRDPQVRVGPQRQGPGLARPAGQGLRREPLLRRCLDGPRLVEDQWDRRERRHPVRPGGRRSFCASGDWRKAYANYLVQRLREVTPEGVPGSMTSGSPTSPTGRPPTTPWAQRAPAQAVGVHQGLRPGGEGRRLQGRLLRLCRLEPAEELHQRHRGRRHGPRLRRHPRRPHVSAGRKVHSRPTSGPGCRSGGPGTAWNDLGQQQRLRRVHGRGTCADAEPRGTPAATCTGTAPRPPPVG
ncbi:hypothetical protein SPURM210S_00004 [Streptomyces purpurascens]